MLEKKEEGDILKYFASGRTREITGGKKFREGWKKRGSVKGVI